MDGGWQMNDMSPSQSGCSGGVSQLYLQALQNVARAINGIATALAAFSTNVLLGTDGDGYRVGEGETAGLEGRGELH